MSVTPAGRILTKWSEFETHVLKGDSDLMRDRQRVAFYTGAIAAIDEIRKILEEAPSGKALERFQTLEEETHQYFDARFAREGLNYRERVMKPKA